MKTQSKLFLSERNSVGNDLSECDLIFLLATDDEFNLNYSFSHQDLIPYLSFQINKAPKHLIYHIQRIYHCFQENLTDQLYASLLDLAIILQGNKNALSRRMFNATKLKLKGEQRNALEQYYQYENINESDLPVNCYSVLSEGYIGSQRLINSNIGSSGELADLLSVAQDFIEYSQLEEARKVLEKAIIEQPDIVALHTELLGLYKSTKDIDNFQYMYETLEEQENSQLQLWQELETLFVEKCNEE